LFKVVAPARTFLFACESQQELDAWLAAIQVEIAFAADMAAGRDPAAITKAAAGGSGIEI
jgi:hypothetical protein